jgi:Holliday junction DNA helicase RuvA
MISWLRGVLREKYPPFLLVDVHGIGYELEAPTTLFPVLPEPGQEVSLYTHQVVREAAHSLYAFVTVEDRDLFRLLLRVNGVGARLALAILSGMEAKALACCIQEGDTASLMKLPGVGKKTAQRLVMEMRDSLSLQAYWRRPPAPSAMPGESADPVHEAISALVSLGFRPLEANRLVQGLDCTGLACEEIVRRALQATAK